MRNSLMRILVAAVMLFAWVVSAAQTRSEYIDIYTVQVKPDKRAEFDALTKRMAEANRRNGGDEWLAIENMYGEGNVINFVSYRSSYGDVETGMNKFMGAATKSFGAGLDKMMADWGSCLISSKGELRKRRWDLSANAPSDAGEYAKLVANSRFLRTTMVSIRPGRTADFEALLKEYKAAREKNSPNEVLVVSQGVAGQQGGVYYITAFKPNMAGFDNVPTMQKVLGDEAFTKFQKTGAEVIEQTTAVLSRLNPDLSNPPQDILAAAPDYWTPKPVVAATGKKKAANKEQAGQ